MTTNTEKPPKFDGNTLINLAVVITLGVAVLGMVVGAIVLPLCGKPVPEFMGNALIGITGGLVGYLAREMKPSHPIEKGNNDGKSDASSGSLDK